MWTLFLKAKSQITEADADNMKKESWPIFKSLADKQNKAIEGEKPSALFLTALREMLSTGRVKLADVSCTILPEGFIGWRDNEFAYLLGDTTYNAVCKFYRERDKTFPLTKRLLMKHLSTEKLIMSDTENSKQKKLGGKNRRVVWLYADALEENDEKEENDDV